MSERNTLVLDGSGLSVVIPCHNAGRLLAETVESVERHALGREEIVVVDDGSTDPSTIDVLQGLRSSGHTVVDQPNQGASAARNTGIKTAQGRYILTLDADDLIRRALFDDGVRILDTSPEVGVVYGGWQEFGARDRLIRAPEFFVDVLVQVNFACSCALFRKELWISSGGYDIGLLTWEDWDFWLSLAERGAVFHRLEQVVVDYRIHGGSKLTRMDRPDVVESSWAHVATKHRALIVPSLLSIVEPDRATEGDPLSDCLATLGQRRPAWEREAPEARLVLDNLEALARHILRGSKTSTLSGRCHARLGRWLHALRNRLTGSPGSKTKDHDRLWRILAGLSWIYLAQGRIALARERLAPLLRAFDGITVRDPELAARIRSLATTLSVESASTGPS